MGGVWAVVAAAGSGSRMGAERNKLLLPLCGVPVIARTLAAFESAPSVEGVALSCSSRDIPDMREIVRKFGLSKVKIIAEGGATRQESVHNALKEVCGVAGIVLIHDGARPFVSIEDIARCAEIAKESGSCIVGKAVIDTIKGVEGDRIIRSYDRSRLFAAQTPQGFKAGDILRWHERAAKEGFSATDDAMLAERYGHSVRVIESEGSNMKLTTPEDFRIAEALICGNHPQTMRSGIGYDVHRLTEDRELILCGVKIPHKTGLLGHSDADVAVHALIDAILGACSMGDIGEHFPDSDPAYKGISSIKLLGIVMERVREKSFALVNCDLTIICQKPKLSAYKDEMRKSLSDALCCDISAVSVKAKTTEGLGFEGREEGISCLATASVVRI